MISRQIRDFYTSHSPTSNPGPLSPMLDDLSVDVVGLIDVIGGLLLHPHTAHNLFRNRNRLIGEQASSR